MTLELECDGEFHDWDDDIKSGDEVFCSACYRKLLDQIEELKAEIIARDEIIENLEQHNMALKDELDSIVEDVENGA